MMPQQVLNLDPGLYTRPEVLEAERARIFRRSWQYIGPVSSVLAPGQYLSANLAGIGVFAIRGKDGALRGFRNICRHRGARLLADRTGNCGLIRCPYHHWAYGDTGRLVQAPWFGTDPAIVPEDWPLEPVALQSWRGLLFAAIDPEDTLEDQLGDLIAEVAEEPIETYAATDHARVDFDANWKVYTDNYVEGYHIPGTHPTFYAAIDFERFETTAHRGMVRMTAPPRPGLFYRGKWLWVWPNLTLSQFQGGISVSRINPLGVDRTEQYYDFYFADTSAAGAEDRARSVTGTLAVVREDCDVCAQTQASYAGGGYTPGPLSSRHEKGVHYFQTRVAAALA